MSTILEVESLTKTFKSGQREIKVLDNINFKLETGKSMSIVGPSGSGKTTLLGLCAGLDRASEGKISLDNILLNKLGEDDLAQLRNQEVGFIFQNFQLISTLTALENVMVPLELRGEKNITPFAKELLTRVGLGDRLDHYPSQLSGGEQQRVAIARAFANRPKILFADEPTGNLDEETSNSIESILFEINKEQGTTLVIVTHDDALAHKTDRILKLKGGKIVS
ncbi:MAG: ABC transporter ATP-binding protein [Marinoscillum sp.]